MRGESGAERRDAANRDLYGLSESGGGGGRRVNVGVTLFCNVNSRGVGVETTQGRIYNVLRRCLSTYIQNV